MIITLLNIIFIASIVGLGTFVLGRAGSHRPAPWLLAYTVSLACYTLSQTAGAVTDTVGARIIFVLSCLGVSGISLMLMYLLSALFVPEWWEGPRPVVHWIALPYIVAGALSILDFFAGLGLFTKSVIAVDGGYLPVAIEPGRTIMLSLFSLSWLVHMGILGFALVRRPALRVIIGTMAATIVLAVVGALLLTLVWNLPKLSGIVVAPFIASLAYAVFRTRLFVPNEVAFELAMTSMRDAVMVIDARGYVTYRNPAAATLGIAADGPVLEALASASIDQVLLADLERRITDGSGQSAEEVVLAFGKRQVSVSWVAVRDPEGRQIGTLFLGRDMTEVLSKTDELVRERHRLEETVHQLEAEQDQRASLTRLVREISLPVIPVQKGVLVMPLVGDFDTDRGTEFMATLLQAIEREHAHWVLIDITGVPLIDTFGAAALIRAVQAARLLGARCTMVGIRPEIAQSLVTLGLTLDEMPTAATLEQGLRTVLARGNGQVTNSKATR